MNENIGKELAASAPTSATRVNVNKMGLLGAVSYIIGNILGAGLFITPTAVLEHVDTVGLSLIIWVVAALISVLGAFCYVELGTSIRLSGADYAYLCYVKWYPVAFAFMFVGCFFLYPIYVAIQAETFSEYIIKGFRIKITSEIYEFYARKLIGFSLLWILMALNFLSLKFFVSPFQIVASFAKIAATAIIICTGFYFLIFKGETEHLSHPFEGSKFAPGRIAVALFAGLFSYDGWDVLNFGAEEIEKPKRTMPLAIMMGMSMVAFICLTTNIAFFVVLSTDEIKSSPAVAGTFAAAKLGNFQYAVPFLICILLIGTMNTTLFAASRYLQAASRQGHLPTFLSCADTKHDSPRAALFVCAMLSIGLTFTGNLSQLINYVGFCQWLQRVFTMLALVWIRLSKKPVHPDAIQYPVIMPITFLIICSSLVLTTIIKDIDVCIIGLSVLFSGFVIYFLFLYEHSLRTFKIFNSFTYYVNNKLTIFTQIIFNSMPNVCTEETALEVKQNTDSRISSELSSTNKDIEMPISDDVKTTEIHTENGFFRRIRKSNTVYIQ